MIGRLTAGVIMVLVAAPAAAHPGRLDATGCHTVRQDFHYADGRVVQAGEYHCHRLLGVGGGMGMKLDGKESLQDNRHDHDAPPKDLGEPAGGP